MKTKLLIFFLLFTQFKLFCQEERTDKLLNEVFSKATKTFPSDSASLYQRFFIWSPTTDIVKKQKQIDRINSLLTESSIKRYRNVENNLKPLMTKIVAENRINKKQLSEFMTLYCDYDYFRGEALLTKILTEDENYSLVWKTFDIIIEASKTDNTYISALVEFDDKLRTNVELTESIKYDFLLKSIKNNPKGFLDIYLSWEKGRKVKFINEIIEHTELLSTFTNIYENTKDDKYKEASMEIIQSLR